MCPSFSTLMTLSPVYPECFPYSSFDVEFCIDKRGTGCKYNADISFLVSSFCKVRVVMDMILYLGRSSYVNVIETLAHYASNL